jgi:hypothetical protein
MNDLQNASLPARLLVDIYELVTEEGIDCLTTALSEISRAVSGSRMIELNVIADVLDDIITNQTRLVPARMVCLLHEIAFSLGCHEASLYLCYDDIGSDCSLISARMIAVEGESPYTSITDLGLIPMEDAGEDDKISMVIDLILDYLEI